MTDIKLRCKLCDGICTVENEKASTGNRGLFVFAWEGKTRGIWYVSNLALQTKRRNMVFTE